MARFSFSEIQAAAILDMRLQKLTSLETQKIIDELNEVLTLIAYLEDLLAHEEKIYGVIKDETNELSEKHGDDRKTEILEQELENVDLEGLDPGRRHGGADFHRGIRQARSSERVSQPRSRRQGFEFRQPEGRGHRAGYSRGQYA